MSIYESSITNPKKQLEFYKQLSEQLQQENQQLKDRIELAIEYIRDCCNMDSKWTNLHFDYAQNEMLSDQVDELLDLLKGDKE